MNNETNNTRIATLEKQVADLTALVETMNKRLSKQFLLQDRVVDKQYGKGTIVEIDNSVYSLGVEFDNGETASFTRDGREFLENEKPSLKLLPNERNKDKAISI